MCMSRVELIDTLEKNITAKREVDVDGNILINHLPSVGVRSYLHVIFEKVDVKRILQSLDNWEIKIPRDFLDLLDQYNGANFFQGALSIFGVRSELSRSPGARQPFDIFEANTIARPGNLKGNELYIGSYNWDGSIVVIENSSSAVRHRLPDSMAVSNEWSDLDYFIKSEVARLSLLFDENGAEIDPRVPTSPFSL